MLRSKNLARFWPAVVVAAALCAGWPAVAKDAPSWPRFRGPNGDNVSPETGLLGQWPEAGPPLLWTAQGIGQGYGSISIAKGRISVAGDIDKEDVVTALDLEGRVLWRFANGAAWLKDVPGGRGTPAVDGDRVYYENAHGLVVCLDARSGQQVWSRDIVKECGGRFSAWGYGDSVVLDRGRVICCPGGATAMAALDARTGSTVWKSPTVGEAAGYATPIVVAYRGLRMVLTMSERSLIGVNADTGDLLFKFEHVNPQYVANCVTPIYHDGRVFVSCGYGKGSALLKISVSGKKASVEPVWQTADLDCRMGGVVLLDGFLYGASQWTNKGQWACLEWESGRLRHADKGVGEGAVAAADGMLYTLSERRRVGLVKATPEGHQVVSQFTLPDGGGGPTWAHPVVCGGRLYVRHGDRLYAYDVRTK